MVNLGSEISSLMKWTTVMLTLNGGLVLIAFSLLARENQCTEHLQKTFLHPGVFLALAGGIGLFFAIVGSLVPLLMKVWRRYGR